MGLRSAALWLCSVALSWLPGCTTTDAFTCNADDQCVSDGQAGRCEAEGVCSFPDPSCPSGRRYGLLAGEHAGECVGGGSSDGSTGVGTTSIAEPLDTAADDDTGPSATSTTTATGTTMTTSEPDSTSEPGSMTSTTSPTSTTDPETTGGSPLDPYGPCSDDADCPVEGSLCIHMGTSVCAPPCGGFEPCFYDGPTGSGLGCYPVGDLGDGCVFLCTGDQCPEGMVCEPFEGIGYCAWEPGTGP